MTKHFGQNGHDATNHQALQPFDLGHFGSDNRQAGAQWRQRAILVIAGDEFVLSFHDHTRHSLSLFGSKAGCFELVGNAQRVNGDGCRGANLPQPAACANKNHYLDHALTLRVRLLCSKAMFCSPVTVLA